MALSTYLRLVLLTAGTLLPLFWMVVILGHRRQRNFERVFFFLCLALLFFFGASLLALNTRLYYPKPPEAITLFSWILVCAGLWFLPSLLLHLNAEYAAVRGELAKAAKRGWILAAYAPAILLAPSLAAALRTYSSPDFVVPGRRLGSLFPIWVLIAVLGSGVWQARFAKTAPDQGQKNFHRLLAWTLFTIGVCLAILHETSLGRSAERAAALNLLIGACSLLPLVGLIRRVEKHNFLQIGRQRNLVYAVFAAFLALLYLGLVRRASMWLESYFPPEATAAILLFLPVFFFEPLQRFVSRLLQRTAQREMDLMQRLFGPIQDVARLGDSDRLKHFVAQSIRERLQLAEVRLELAAALLPSANDPLLAYASESTHFDEAFPIRQGGRLFGTLRVRAHGAMLSGEIRAALEFLSDQLPSAIELCRLIEEKLRLERELAERERLALVGQTAASISHNLKNPLGSIKTILQVQLERPEMPDSMRAETKMVLDEISRLSAKLSQLLQFSRPAVRCTSLGQRCDARVVLEQVAGVLGHEADRRGVRLSIACGGKPLLLPITPEILSDVISNLVVNALEATPSGGHVSLAATANGGTCTLSVEDDGPGISAAARDKILQPFFTTKPQGTGLGLAIVSRRVAEAGGDLRWESPVKDGRGARFEVVLKLLPANANTGKNGVDAAAHGAEIAGRSEA